METSKSEERAVPARDILVPADGSDYSRTAIRYALYLAGKLNAKLAGLHVVDLKIIQGPLFSDIAFYSGLPAYYEFLPTIEEALERRADRILGEFEKMCRNAGVPFEGKKARGIIDEVIILEGKKTDWTLLAQRGEHSHLGQGIILGSTAEAVARKSHKPVMITPREFREIESMGLAFDGSPPATTALRIATELSSFVRWPLTVIIVSDVQDAAAKLVHKVESFVEPYEIDCEVLTMTGREDREILNFIREGSVELMIMGAFGRGRVKEFLLGSTTSFIIRNSSIPVLLTH
jgi:nucleotide-binding universal stress UspA family protein